MERQKGKLGILWGLRDYSAHLHGGWDGEARTRENTAGILGEKAATWQREGEREGNENQLRLRPIANAVEK